MEDNWKEEDLKFEKKDAMFCIKQDIVITIAGIFVIILVIYIIDDLNTRYKERQIINQVYELIYTQEKMIKNIIQGIR